MTRSLAVLALLFSLCSLVGCGGEDEAPNQTNQGAADAALDALERAEGEPSADAAVAPLSDSAGPDEEVSLDPVDGANAPADSASRADDVAGPSADSASPIEDAAEPSADSASPVEDASEGSADSASPAQDASEGSDAASAASDIDTGTEEVEGGDADAQVPSSDSEAPTDDSLAPSEDAATGTDAASMGDAGPGDDAQADPCEECLASGGTWQPEANACTANCDIMDISCYTSSCPAPCGPESCSSCIGAEECEAAGCQWNAEPPAFWCTEPWG